MYVWIAQNCVPQALSVSGIFREPPGNPSHFTVSTVKHVMGHYYITTGSSILLLYIFIWGFLLSIFGDGHCCIIPQTWHFVAIWDSCILQHQNGRYIKFLCQLVKCDSLLALLWWCFIRVCLTQTSFWPGSWRVCWLLKGLLCKGSA